MDPSEFSTALSACTSVCFDVGRVRKIRKDRTRDAPASRASLLRIMAALVLLASGYFLFLDFGQFSIFL